MTKAIAAHLRLMESELPRRTHAHRPPAPPHPRVRQYNTGRPRGRPRKPAKV